MCQVSLLSGTIFSPSCVIVTQDGGGNGTVTHTTSQIGEGRLYESQIRGFSNHHPERGILSLEPSHSSPAILPLGICSFWTWHSVLRLHSVIICVKKRG